MNTKPDQSTIVQGMKYVGLIVDKRGQESAVGLLDKYSESRYFDNRLKKKLVRALSKYSNVNGHRINFEVKEGIVSIFGSVDTPTEKRIIGNMVNLIGGFKRVFNGIHVRSSLFNNEARIAGAILSDLSSYLGLDLSQINVVVKRNTVYLRGFVPTIYMKCAAEELAGSMLQVSPTVNKLKIRH